MTLQIQLTNPMSHHDDYSIFMCYFSPSAAGSVVTEGGGGGMLFNFVSEDVDSSSISSEDRTPSVNERDNSTTTKRKYSCVYT